MKVTTTWLEMFAPPDRPAPPPRDEVTVIHARNPTVAWYRFLYDAVGRDWNWTSRRRLSDAELAAIIGDQRVELQVLYVEGVPAGFAELDRRIATEVELKQFGLVPEFIGRGLGKYFLEWVIDRVYSDPPRRFWLHTCTHDHPAALPNYLRAGFKVYRAETQESAP